MPAVTDCKALPYPVDADPVDVAGDIAKLANALDDDLCLRDVNPVTTYPNLATLQAARPNPPPGAMAQAPAGVPYTFINGTWKQMGYEVDSAHHELNLPPITLIGTYDMQGGSRSLGGYPLLVKTFVDVDIYAGFTTVDMDVAIDVWKLADNTQFSSPTVRVRADGSAFHPLPLHVGWFVQPGQDMGYVIRFRLLGITTTGGTLYVAGNVNHRVMCSGTIA